MSRIQFPLRCPQCTESDSIIMSVQVGPSFPGSKRLVAECRKCQHKWTIDQKMKAALPNDSTGGAE